MEILAVLTRRAREFNLASDETALLALAGLPLVDSAFASTLTPGALRAPTSLLDAGTHVFSGAGCIAVAASLEGALATRLLSVLKVYALVLLAALVAATAPPLLTPLAFDPQLYGALLLVGPAAALAGLSLTPRDPLPEILPARWLHALRLLAVPQVILVVLGAVALLHLLVGGLQPAVPLARADMPGAGLAVLGGLGLTLLAAALVGPIQRCLDMAVVRQTAAGLMGLVALGLVGVSLPAFVSPLLLALGLLAAALAHDIGQEETIGR